MNAEDKELKLVWAKRSLFVQLIYPVYKKKIAMDGSLLGSKIIQYQKR